MFRLFAVIDPEFRAALPATVESDMRRFLDEVSNEPTDLKTLGLASTSIEAVLGTMRVIYGIA